MTISQQTFEADLYLELFDDKRIREVLLPGVTILDVVGSVSKSIEQVKKRGHHLSQTPEESRYDVESHIYGNLSGKMSTAVQEKWCVEIARIAHDILTKQLRSNA